MNQSVAVETVSSEERFSIFLLVCEIVVSC